MTVLLVAVTAVSLALLPLGGSGSQPTGSRVLGPGVEDDSMTSLGRFVAEELDLSIEACR